uniref:Imaginal disc growth factor n=1 Tax=Hepialus humuli TaxID=470875 RepID=A0A5Q0MUA6_HEPHU|nr:imaginal disc growth factor [Hepialus humuli]
MWVLSLIATFCLLFVWTEADTAHNKVVCYYDSRSFAREKQGKMILADLEPALTFCTHLVYGYAGIQPDTYRMVPLNENLDTDKGHALYRNVAALNKKYPGLKVLLSVGGGADKEEKEKYNLLLESPEARTKFINSAVQLTKQYGFDGLDIAWEFPENKPKKIRGAIGSLWHGFKKIFKTTPVDENAEQHREGYTAFIRELKQAVRPEKLILTATVLPNVNSTIYYDVSAIINHLDFVNLEGFDFYTPERNPSEADYTAPLYEAYERNPGNNINHLTQYWLTNGAPGSKIVVGIATFGRTWKMTSSSNIAGVPPLEEMDGPGEEGPYSKTPGLLSYPEVCAKLINPDNQKGLLPHLRKVPDPSKRFGTYAFRVPDDNDEGGLWVGYEDPDSAGDKANYVRAKGLGGVAIVDLSLDDFRGSCTGDKYPILRAAKYRL